MAEFFENDLNPTQLFRLITGSNDPRIKLIVRVDSKRSIDRDFVIQGRDVGSSFDFRESDLPARIRVYVDLMAFPFGVKSDVQWSKLSTSSWHLQFLFQNRLCGTGRVDIVNVDEYREPALSSSMPLTVRINDDLRVALKLTSNEHLGQNEGITVTKQGWSSPGGGWLYPQSGGWLSLPDGLHLLGGQSNRKAAICRGLIVATTKTGALGNSLYPEMAGTGKWEVLDVQTD